VIDNYRAGVLAAGHLLERGHKDFAMITGPQDIALCRERIKGFTDTLERHGLFLKGQSVFQGDFTFASGIAAATHFLKEGIAFSALWAQNDDMALGAMNVFARNKIRVPEDISVVGMDDTLSAQRIVPSLTSVAQPFPEMCHEAVNALIALIQNESLKANRVVLQPTLIVRESTTGALAVASRAGKGRD
jgi:DNA-binding LacI/PurR family transcriptional regulator